MTPKGRSPNADVGETQIGELQELIGEREMVTYEITATVRADLCETYERYMSERHIPDLLETGAFAGASLSRSAPGRYRIRYEARSRAALDRYLAEHAPRLRQHFAESFPAGVELAREEWSLLASWPRSRESAVERGGTASG